MAKPRSLPIYTSPADAATAFYQAFESKDIDAMMAAWAEDEEIVCIHPGGPRLVGYDAVRAGWEQIFAGETRLSIELHEVMMMETVGLAMHTVVEHITVSGDRGSRGRVAATNVILRTPSGWRIVMHHASPVPANIAVETKGPLH